MSQLRGSLVVEAFLMLESLDFIHVLAAVFHLGMMVGCIGDNAHDQVWPMRVWPKTFCPTRTMACSEDPEDTA